MRVGWDRLEAALGRVVGRPLHVFAIAALAFGLSTGGRPVAAGDTRYYVRLSDAVLQGSLGDFFAQAAAKWMVLIYACLVALARSITSTHWMDLLLALNVLCAAATAALLVSLVGLATRSWIAAAAALVLYIACWDVRVWVRYILTDTPFALLALLAFALSARGILGLGDPARRRLALAPVVALCPFGRPQGVLIPFLIVAYELFLVPGRRPEGRPGRGAGRRTAIVLVALGLLSVFVLRAAVLHDPARWPFSYLRPKLEQFSKREKRGEIVLDRPELHGRAPASTVDHARIQLERFVRFFQVTAGGYSPRHSAANLAYYVPLYLLAILGAARGLRARDPLVLAALLWIFAHAYLAALTLLDYDWRHRLTVMPQLILLASLGVTALLGRAHAPLAARGRPQPAAAGR